MSKRKHTPGPWLDGDEWVHQPDDLLTETANAYLMGSAPELLAACRQVQPAIQTLLDEMGKGPATKWKLVNDCLCAVGAAIAKAEGKVTP